MKNLQQLAEKKGFNIFQYCGRPGPTIEQTEKWLETSRPGDEPFAYFVGFELPYELRDVAARLRRACEDGDVMLAQKKLSTYALNGVDSVQSIRVYQAIKVSSGTLSEIERKLDC